ncbi:hypothetical protein [Bacillus pumilus]|uniref:hypothetical protein n=1 Tax=Bacillus pumilus TaxID=1408 RepID=UPI001C223C21|nr:hypothetical protein [Bacillus pumilus]MBU8575715.1 hypothetical protein [Bacillus pumilus]
MDDKEQLGKIKESYSDCVDMALSEGETLPYYDIEVSDMAILIRLAEKGLTNGDRELRGLYECVKVMQQIKLICVRAKHHYVEKKDIEDILKLLEGIV